MYDGSLFSCKIAQMCVGEIIKLFPVRIVDQKKSNALLLFKPIHKGYLMPVNVLQGKGILGTFLCIKADRNSLYCTYIVNSTSLVKVCQSNVTVLFVHAYRSDGSGNLLYQSKSLLPVLIVCSVYKVLQGRTPEPSAVPCRHSYGSS